LICFEMMNGNVSFSSQMTLRDYFAAQAMRVCPQMDAYNMKANEGRFDFIARKSYEIADAMLKEREK
jgi:hypothetical protein